MGGHKAGDKVELNAAAAARKMTAPQLEQLKVDGRLPETVVGELVERGNARSWLVKLPGGATVEFGTRMFLAHEAAPEIFPPAPLVEEDLESSSDEEVQVAAPAARNAADDGWGDKVEVLEDPACRHFDGDARLVREDLVDSCSSTAAMDMFKAFFPPLCLKLIIEHTQQKGMAMFNWTWELTEDIFFAWIGLWIAMTRVQLPNIRQYWPRHMGPLDAGLDFSHFMTMNRFNEIKSALTLPEGGDGVFGPVERFVSDCSKHWQRQYKPGRYLIPDETMIFWTGQGGHITHMPRKPTPVGICMKSMADSNRIILNLELMEGKKVDEGREWYREFGAGTSCALRLVKPWFHTYRTVVADSWFGSVKTAAELRRHGLLSIMSLKNAHKHFPKQRLLGMVKNRGESAFLVKEVQGHKIIAAAHQDRHPMLLVGTTGTSDPAPTVDRTCFRINGAGEKVQLNYSMDQPDFFWQYRTNFNAIDVADKLALGPGSIIEVWRTKNVYHRIFAAMVAIMECNAYNAIVCFNKEYHNLSRDDWRRMLATQLCDRLSRNQTETLVEAGHKAHMSLKKLKTSRVCWLCSERSYWTCDCGEVVCSPLTEGDRGQCWTKHMIDASRRSAGLSPMKPKRQKR